MHRATIGGFKLQNTFFSRKEKKKMLEKLEYKNLVISNFAFKKVRIIDFK